MSSTGVTLSVTLVSIQNQMTRYIYSIFLVFGISGSCLNILLLSRKQFRTSSCCTYLVAMSTAILILLGWVSGLYLYALDHPDPVRTMPTFCKLRIYILQSSALMYRWCLTIACFDRYALSAADQRFRNLAKVEVARRAVIVIIAMWIVLPMHSLIFYNLQGDTCGILYSSAAALYHSIFTTVVAGVLPPAIMGICAVLIYRNLVRRQQRRQLMMPQEMSQRNGVKRLASKRDHQVLLMLLIQALCYVITTMPLMCMYFYNALTVNVMNKSADRAAIERFSQYATELINFLFPTCSFYLYTLSSRMFRKELIAMICSVLHHQPPANTTRVTPISNDIQLVPVTRNGSRALSLSVQSAARRKKSGYAIGSNR